MYTKCIQRVLSLWRKSARESIEFPYHGRNLGEYNYYRGREFQLIPIYLDRKT